VTPKSVAYAKECSRWRNDLLLERSCGPFYAYRGPGPEWQPSSKAFLAMLKATELDARDAESSAPTRDSEAS
jgi:hypothetical protein